MSLILQALAATISLQEFGQGGKTAKKWHAKFKIKMLPLINRPDLQTFTYYIKNKSKSCLSQVQSPSHCFTGKLEQKTTTNLSHWNLREKDDGSTVLVLFVAQRTLLKSGALHSAMQCILVKSNKFENLYSLLLIFLNPDYVTARSQRSLGSDKDVHFSIGGRFAWVFNFCYTM